ncbi:hypothetical protein [Bacillus mycoides]|uniref:hypothetical protein n=1 Tax=Bacillus mycoides TaxID=1405 RepID=UPI0003DBD60B|nr:hypothetical protein [Bacillus mycoides]GAE42916.1 hypothetical protein BW1_076_00710 [Bacillus mycoides NBRC 101238 = DSM 11821]
MKNRYVEEHLLEIKELAESYGEKIGIKHLAGLAGMLHNLNIDLYGPLKVSSNVVCGGLNKGKARI